MLQAAVKAERRRREAKKEHHREEVGKLRHVSSHPHMILSCVQYKFYQQRREEEELEILAEKHGVDPRVPDPLEFA